MVEIKTGKELLLENVLSFRGIINQAGMQETGMDMENVIKEAGLKRKGTPVTATYDMKDGNIDIEILIPVEGDLSKINNNKYKVKEKVHIVNAVAVNYIGNPSGLQTAYDELNKYIADNGLQAITVGYSITKRMNPTDMDNTQIEIYVGINPNVL